MALADYQQETCVISFKGGSFTVKGLSLTEITTLVRYHLPDLEAIYELGADVLGGKVDVDADDLSRLAGAFIDQAPGFVANLIALAAGETEEAGIEAAYKLPFPLQLKTLTAIADLTFSEVGGIKKGLESVAGLMKTMKPMLPQVKVNQR